MRPKVGGGCTNQRWGAYVLPREDRHTASAWAVPETSHLAGPRALVEASKAEGQPQDPLGGPAGQTQLPRGAGRGYG